MDLVGHRTLREILEFRAESHPEKPFVLFDDTDYIARSTRLTGRARTDDNPFLVLVAAIKNDAAKRSQFINGRQSCHIQSLVHSARKLVPAEDL